MSTETLPAVRSGAPPAVAPVARPILDPDSLTLDLWTSIPDTERALIIRLMQGKAESIADYIGKPVSVRHVLAHRVESVDQETGELLTLDRIVLVTPTGQAIQCTSQGVRKSLQIIMHYYGVPPWEPALRVQVDQVTTRRGFRTFTLSPVGEDVTPSASRK